MAFYVKMSSAPGECAREALRQGLGVSAAVAIGYTVVNHDHGKFQAISALCFSSTSYDRAICCDLHLA